MVHKSFFRLSIALWLTVVLLQTVTAHAAGKVLDAASIRQGPAILTEYFSILEDASTALQLKDIQQPEFSDRFTHSTSSAEALNFGFTASAYWLRLTVENRSSQPIERMIEITSPRHASIQLFHSDPDRLFQVIDTGYNRPISSRPYKSRFFVFPLSMAPNTTQTYYLRFLSKPSAMEIPARMWVPADFYAYERIDYIAQAWYFGGLMAMAAFNLLLFFALRDSSYLYYVLFVCFSGLGVATNNGLTTEYLLGSLSPWQTSVNMTAFSGALIFMMLFTRRMLRTYVHLPVIDKWLKRLVGFHLLQIVGLFAFPAPFVKLSLAAGAATGVFILLAGLAGLYKRQRSAAFFVLAFSMLLVGGILTALRGYGIVPTNVVTTNGMQLGSALEMLLLAFALADRFNIIRREKERAQQLLVETLRTSERILEERVEQRTAELQATLRDLRATQSQLIQSEKMASLGQLVANVAHEFNTPIGAVKSSGRNITDALDQTLSALPELFSILGDDEKRLFIRLINGRASSLEQRSSRDERRLIRETERQLEADGIGDARNMALMLVRLGSHTEFRDFLPLLQSPHSALILRTAGNIAAIVSNAGNINIAVDRVSRIMFALKAFLRVDGLGTITEVRVEDGIETVLTLYQAPIRRGVEVVRDYEEIPLVPCVRDELNQVWINLIQNALQAMGYKGRLTIRIARVGSDAAIFITDTGTGIPDEIRERIFDPFFTTLPAGEGAGLGLDIVKRIVEKHKGRLEVESEIGRGSTFKVFLPLTANR